MRRLLFEVITDPETFLVPCLVALSFQRCCTHTCRSKMAHHPVHSHRRGRGQGKAHYPLKARPHFDCTIPLTFLVAQLVKNLPAMRET